MRSPLGCLYREHTISIYQVILKLHVINPFFYLVTVQSFDVDVREFTLSSREQREILQRHHPDCQDLLDLEQIYPFLNQRGLLTDTEQEQLLPVSRFSRREKITVLLNSLPKKGSHSLFTFITALQSSSDGTAHSELANQLWGAVQECMAKKKQATKSEV